MERRSGLKALIINTNVMERTVWSHPVTSCLAFVETGDREQIPMWRAECRSIVHPGMFVDPAPVKYKEYNC